MKHQRRLIELREELSKLSHEIDESIAGGHFDVSIIMEDIVCSLFRSLFDWPALRNLNAESSNYPAIDLADDQNRIAIQVTADTSLAKVKETLDTFLRHDLDKHYDRVVIFLLRREQNSYSQSAINDVVGDRFIFNAREDIMDMRDIASQAARAKPASVAVAHNELIEYVRGIEIGLAQEDFDPPGQPSESVILNAIEVYFPPTVYIADLVPEVKPIKGRIGYASVYEAGQALGLTLPRDYEARSKQLITFHNLSESSSAFTKLVDLGTVTGIPPEDFAAIDADHERVFKSLLRRVLEDQLMKHHVHWKHKRHLFAFHPNHRDDDVRKESWTGGRKEGRIVFERKMNNKDPSKILSVKHLAFQSQFQRISDRWYLVIVPDWFFSYGDEYRQSGFSDQQVTNMKRLEKNQSLLTQYKFWADWLAHSEDRDLFDQVQSLDNRISFGETISISGAPLLDELLWEPIIQTDTEHVHPDVDSLFSPQ